MNFANSSSFDVKFLFLPFDFQGRTTETNVCEARIPPTETRRLRQHIEDWLEMPEVYLRKEECSIDMQGARNIQKSLHSVYLCELSSRKLASLS